MYNISMSKNNVIDFGSRKKQVAALLKAPQSKMDHELDMAREIMHGIVGTLAEYRYDPANDEEMINDLGVIYTMIYAMMIRADGEYHQFHEMMAELATELKKHGG